MALLAYAKAANFSVHSREQLVGCYASPPVGWQHYMQRRQGRQERRGNLNH
mgnify:CR=1 FL=1